MDKFEKAEKKYARKKEKAIKTTLKKARVPKDATPEQVKAYLIHYVKNLKSNFYKLRFTDEQLSDPNFLLGLYKANINILRYISPTNENLINNVDFMIEYIKLRHNKEMMSYKTNDKYLAQSNLNWIIKRYIEVMSNPEFIVKLAKEFPNLEIISLVKASFLEKYDSLILSEKDRQQKEDNKERYKECLSKLPIELLCKQVKNHSYDVLKNIPNDIPNFNQLISIDIDKNGFESLKHLDITQVLYNEDLIIKAYKKEGFKALADYIQYSLSPQRNHVYVCHGEPHSYTSYDKRYEEVQKELISSPKIKAIFDKNNAKMESRTQISINSPTSK